MQKIAPFLIGAALIVLGFLQIFFLAGLMLGIIGFFFVSFVANVNSTLQLNTDNAHRGRVMSVYTLVFAGSSPLGNLFTGAIITWFGATWGFIACGGVTIVLLIPLYFMSRKRQSVIPV
jgi:MFS family permease